LAASGRIAVIYAHSATHLSRVNRLMRDAVRELPTVTVRDLYDTYPDFHIEVGAEQALLEAADLVVLQHPLQWYGMPSLLKEWVDAVLTHGWAYGEGGDRLRGKAFMLVVTAGGTAPSYAADGVHGYPFADFLPPYIQIARLCGMRWQPPLILHGAHRVDDAAVARHVSEYVARLSGFAAVAAARGQNLTGGSMPALGADHGPAEDSHGT